jgi:glycosyltransferase involved in cell wall biosynthesis
MARTHEEIYAWPMRVLLMAEDCNPEWPALSVVGYQMTKALSLVADVTLATHVRNRYDLKDRLPDTRVEVIDTEYIAAPLYKLGTWLKGSGNDESWSTATALAYPSIIAFDYEVQQAFGRRIESGEFDVVHRLTPLSPALPSPMATWCPVPYVLGPLNGGLAWPEPFRAERSREGQWLSRLRNGYKVLPYHRSTYRNASAILASFQHTLADIPADARERCIDFPEVGVAPESFPYPGQRPDRRKLVFLCVGRFMPLELLDVAVRVFAESKKLRAHQLVLVGDGLGRAALERQVQESGLGGVVEFAGSLDQAQVSARLRQADILFFPSLCEQGGGVVLEAMASGCVPVVANHGGPGGLVSGYDRGVAVPLGDKDALAGRFTEALERYSDDRMRRLDHAEAAYERAIEHFSWDAKARKLREVYEWVIGRRSIKPVFGDRAMSTPWPVSSALDVAAYGT